MFVVEAPPRPKVFKLPPAAPPVPLSRSFAARVVDSHPLVLASLLLAIGVSLLLSKKPLLVITHEPSPMAIEASAAAPAAKATSLQAANQGNNVALHDDSGAIVGQLAKIPAETEQITEIKSVSDIDNGAGRELLSIISKY